jgi:hypothetical protein
LIGDVPFKAETLVGVAMKHVNEPLPNVQKRRPGVSAALAAVVERATQKEPKKRYSGMGEMLTDLEGALEVEIARSGGGTGDTTSVLDAVPTRNRLLSSRTVSIAGVLLVLAGVLVALALVEIGGEPESRPRDEGPSAPPSGGAIEIVEVSDFDPGGDGEEHADEVRAVIDGDAEGTAWSTENYVASPVIADATNPPKPGVGLILDAGDVVAGRQLQITTENTGWVGEVYGAAEGPPSELEDWGEPIGTIDMSDNETTVELNDNESQYYLIWITELTDNPEGEYFASISDVNLLG